MGICVNRGPALIPRYRAIYGIIHTYPWNKSDLASRQRVENYQWMCTVDVKEVFKHSLQKYKINSPIVKI